MRLIIAIFLIFFMTSCSSQGHNPEAQINIQASAEDQVVVIDATKVFAERNDFEVYATDKMPKKGRLVSQVFLKRSDGVLVAMDNFMKADVLQTTFHIEKPNADWRPIKDAWLKTVREALEGRGEITEVPVGPPPSYVEEERKKQKTDNHEN